MKPVQVTAVEECPEVLAGLLVTGRILELLQSPEVRAKVAEVAATIPAGQLRAIEIEGHYFLVADFGYREGSYGHWWADQWEVLE